MPRDNAVDPDEENNNVAPPGSSDAKRRRLDEDNTDDLASENGFQSQESDEPAKEEDEAPRQNDVNKQAEDGYSPSNETEDTVKPDQVEGNTEETDQQSTDNLEAADAELGKVESFVTDNGQEPTKEDNEQPSDELPQEEVDDVQLLLAKWRFLMPRLMLGVLLP